MSSNKGIEYVISTKSGKKVLEGKMAKKVRTNKPVIDFAKKALAQKLGAKKPSLHRVKVLRDGEKVGEWTIAPAKKKKAA